ncbi:MAG: hypothetical protein H7326_10930, partial [Bdellovibrionaceae bacterium]|nr:hypothetical protein [Pseudobdellovibrionaceae bacterium]
AGNTGGCLAPTDANSTCNSCDGTGLKVCNPTSINLVNGLLTIQMKSSTAGSFTANSRVKYKITGTTSLGTDDGPAQNLSVNNPFYIRIKWSSLCALAGVSATTCLNFPANQTLSVGIDWNNDDVLDEKIDFKLVVNSVPGGAATEISTTCTAGIANTVQAEGICDYKMKRGDEKVYLIEFQPSTNTMATTQPDVKFDRVAMFYSEGAANAATINNKMPYVTLSVTSDTTGTTRPSISENKITGLKNGINYCFALGNMDQTGNILNYPKNAVLTDGTKVCAKPTPVVGLLDDKSCFIATATFGSQMAPEVVTFRQFRNQFLLTNSPGRAFVKAYYKFGPIAANWISESSVLKSISLGILWPLLLFVKLSLSIGLFQALLSVFAGMTFVSLVALRIKRRNRELAA